MPLLYGVPCLFLNWYPSYLIAWGRRNWTVMKPLTAADGRRVTDWNAYTRSTWLNSQAKLGRHGTAVADLETGEVNAAVEAFAQRVEAGAPPYNGPGGRNIGRVSLAADGGGFVDVDIDRKPGGGSPIL